MQAAARPARSGKATPSARPGDDSFGTGPVAALYDTARPRPPRTITPPGRSMPTPTWPTPTCFPRVREDIPRPDSKARQRSQPKTRSGRPSRSKHDDDDDWPSTEWDKLSDEQYWAELSADKPLATTARTAQSSRPAAAKPSRGQPARPAATPRPDRDRAAADPGRRRGRNRAGQDDATQQLDARQTSRSGARPRGAQVPDPGDRHQGSGLAPGQPRRAVGPGHATTTARADAVPQPVARRRGHATQFPPPFRQRRPVTGPIGTGPMDRPDQHRPDDWADEQRRPTRPARPRPVCPVGDDPLTSPAYARDAAPARDSRSYRGSGRAAQRDPAHGAAEDSRGYPRSPDRGDYPAGPRGQDGYPDRRPAGATTQAPAAGTATRRAPASGPTRTLGSAPPYPATAPPARPSWDDDARPAETTSPQSGSGNPYGSFVDSAPPPAPESTGPTYPPAAPPAPAAPAASSQGSYGAGPPAAATAGRPATRTRTAQAVTGTRRQPATAARIPVTTWYSAPPAAAAPPPAAYPYPASPGGYQDSAAYQNGAGYPDSGPYPNGAAYQNGGGGYPDSNDYPGSNGYSAANGQHAQHAQHAQPGQDGYDSRYADDSQQNARYPGGPGTDPYGPDGYGGYHSRQG